MPTRKTRFIYWDSCVFLSYIDEEKDKVDIIERVWDEVSDNEGDRIVTSTLSIAEVAHASYEKAGKALDPTALDKIDAMWRDQSVLLVETPALLMYMARDLMREATAKGWSMRSGDAIHLATAQFVHKNRNPISEFHTYDERLDKFGALIGIKVCRPSPVIKAKQTSFLDSERKT